MSREIGTFNFASTFEVLKKAPLDAKQLVGVKADLTGATTWNASGNIWLFDGAIVSVSNDPDPLNNGIYFLKDADNYDDIDNWVKVGEGTGTITGGTNGLSTDGANIVLGGDLDNNTIIDGQDYDLDIISVNSFSVSTSGLTALVGIDTTGILLEFSGTSVLLENNSGFVYDADYSTTFINESLVTKRYVDAIATGLQPKTAVWVATSTGDTNIDLTGGTFGGTIDGITISNEDRVLIKNQNGIIPDIENGIYIYSADTNTFYRSPDFNGTPEGEVSQGALIPVLTGATNRNTLWVLITADPIVDVTPLSFTPFSTPGNYTGENGVSVSGTVISLDVPIIAGDHIEWDGTQFNVIPSGITSGYTTLSQFNTYTGDTEIRLTTIEDDIIYISGITDTKLDVDIFTGYTATTETRLTGIEDDIDYLSGVTENKLDTSVFTGYTATTEVRLTDIENDIQYISGQTLTISIFTGYTASTETRLIGIEDDIQYLSGITDNKLDTSIFVNYTGTTQPILDAALTGATNGLDFLDREVKLGGTLIENTTINLSTFDLKFSDDSLQYNADYSATYVPRSIPDVDFVTGYTQSAITNNSNVLNIVDFTGVTYTATTESDFIGASGGTTIYLPDNPKDGQRIVVADIAGTCGDCGALSHPIYICSCVPSQHIVGSPSATINTDYGSITFIYNTKGFWSTAAFIN